MRQHCCKPSFGVVPLALQVNSIPSSGWGGGKGRATQDSPPPPRAELIPSDCPFSLGHALAQYSAADYQTTLYPCLKTTNSSIVRLP